MNLFWVAIILKPNPDEKRTDPELLDQPILVLAIDERAAIAAAIRKAALPGTVKSNSLDIRVRPF